MRRTALDGVRHEVRLSPPGLDKRSESRSLTNDAEIGLLTESADVALDRLVVLQRTNVTALASNCVADTEPTKTSALWRVTYGDSRMSCAHPETRWCVLLVADPDIVWAAALISEWTVESPVTGSRSGTFHETDRTIDNVSHSYSSVHRKRRRYSRNLVRRSSPQLGQPA